MEEHLNHEKPNIDTGLQTKLLDNDNHDHRKGGLRTMPFIIVNEAFERVASFGLRPNMIFYLMEVYHMDAATGTSILSVWAALSDGLTIFGAFVSDSYFGRFWVIVIGSLFTLLGMTFIWLSSMLPQLTPSSCNELGMSCSQPSLTQLAFIFLSLGVLSFGSGCIRPCSIAFGADQLIHHPAYNNQRLIDSYFNWYYACVSSSSIVALTLIVYIQDKYGWQVGFAVPALLMVCSALMFLLGSSLYVKVKVRESPFLRSIQVLVIAFKKRKISLLDDDFYNHSKRVDRVELTNNLRFLNKACVIEDLSLESSSFDPWSISTVENVESLKSLIRIIPMWSTGILIYMTTSQSFPTLQAKTMNRHITSGFEIPAASFSLFMVVVLTIWILFYDRFMVPFVARYTNEPRGLHPKTRMGIGILISIVAMMVSAEVETVRRLVARSVYNPNSTVDMSAMWLVLQYALYGLAEAFNAIGQIEFYYSEIPQSMSSIVMALFILSNAISGLVGSFLINVVDSITSEGGQASWLSSDINEGHLDYYYWLLCFLNLLNFFYYLACCCVHRSSSSSESRVSREPGEVGSDRRR
uniref:protein NRT1/ PTR FAMILY 1.2-like n=1 Tax=Erigeron canadensis TaxID=72917 RepID=UPI001CB943D2|nr:protein NRT1/ PTR FAMILY 1.2-like [Erigeron canadensis]XP_043609105.1 protein NRT1/ PTR FAMILY 1.2-like [Erigeron canadensis]XP_043609106.1 protein NRT1/ PTR FAMILY 1.2-like [Erigeron canadensis]